jgi:hypothetical protein
MLCHADMVNALAVLDYDPAAPANLPLQNFVLAGESAGFILAYDKIYGVLLRGQIVSNMT